MKIAESLGTTPAFILALGTNDGFTLTPDQIKTNANLLIDRLIAEGAEFE